MMKELKKYLITCKTSFPWQCATTFETISSFTFDPPATKTAFKLLSSDVI